MTEQSENQTMGATGESQLPIGLDTVLLVLILTISLLYSRYIQTVNALAYRWLHIGSFLVLAGIAGYVAVDFFVRDPKRGHRAKTGILAGLIIVAAVTPMVTVIMLRHSIGPAACITDSAVQTEAAMNMILRGKNPYVENYYKTPLFKFDHKSPALKHYVYLPLTFLLPIPFFLLVKASLGWFDLRMLYLLFYLFTILVLWKLPAAPTLRRALVIVFALNPEIIYYFVYGTNDIVATACLVAAVYLTSLRRYIPAAIFLGIGLLTKQFVIIFLPFYLLYLYGQGRRMWRENDGSWTPLAKTCLVLGGIVAVFGLPMMLWNLNAFFDDIVRYPYGSAVASWHIAGWGISHAALASGLVKTDQSYFPSSLLYLVILLPLSIAMAWRQFKDNTMSVMLTAAALTIFVFVIVSRFTHNNYFYYATTLLFLAYFGNFSRGAGQTKEVTA